MGSVHIELVDRLFLQLDVAIIQMLNVEPVAFIFLVIEVGQLVDRDLVIAIEIFPPSLITPERRRQIGIDHVASFLGPDVEGAHRKNVYAVGGRRSSGGHN